MYSRETFVPATYFEHNVFSPAFADITQGNLARTCGEYIPLRTRENQYIIHTARVSPFSLLLFRRFSIRDSPTKHCETPRLRNWSLKLPGIIDRSCFLSNFYQIDFSTSFSDTGSSKARDTRCYRFAFREILFRRINDSSSSWSTSNAWNVFWRFFELARRNLFIFLRIRSHVQKRF